MTYLEQLTDVSRTQVLAKGLNLKKIIKDEFLKELNAKLNDSYEDIVVADLRLILVPKQKEIPIKEREKGIVIHLENVDFLRFEQPSPEHYRDNVVVISSSRKDNLDKVLR